MDRGTMRNRRLRFIVRLSWASRFWTPRTFTAMATTKCLLARRFAACAKRFFSPPSSELCATRRTLRCGASMAGRNTRSEEHTSELQPRLHLVCRLLLEKKHSDFGPVVHNSPQTLHEHVFR